MDDRDLVVPADGFWQVDELACAAVWPVEPRPVSGANPS
jgi:hypothetical protein